MVNYTDISFTLINHILEYKSDTMKLVKTYKAEKNSASFGQVLYCPCLGWQDTDGMIMFGEIVSVNVVKKQKEKIFWERH